MWYFRDWLYTVWQKTAFTFVRLWKFFFLFKLCEYHSLCFFVFTDLRWSRTVSVPVMCVWWHCASAVCYCNRLYHHWHLSYSLLNVSSCSLQAGDLYEKVNRNDEALQCYKKGSAYRRGNHLYDCNHSCTCSKHSMYITSFSSCFQLLLVNLL